MSPSRFQGVEDFVTESGITIPHAVMYEICRRMADGDSWASIGSDELSDLLPVEQYQEVLNEANRHVEWEES